MRTKDIVSIALLLLIGVITQTPEASRAMAPSATPTTQPSRTRVPAETAVRPSVATPPATVPVTTTRAPQPTATMGSLEVKVRIDEVLPRPGTGDWDGDGDADYQDEWIELYNAGRTPAALGGWYLDDAEGAGPPYRIPAGTLIEPRGYKVFFHRQTGIVLPDGGGEARLLGPDGKAADSVSFGAVSPDASYSRNSTGNWYVDYQPSPGGPNLPMALRTGQLRGAIP